MKQTHTKILQAIKAINVAAQSLKFAAEKMLEVQIDLDKPKLVVDNEKTKQ